MFYSNAKKEIFKAVNEIKKKYVKKKTSGNVVMSNMLKEDNCLGKL